MRIAYDLCNIKLKKFLWIGLKSFNFNFSLLHTKFKIGYMIDFSIRKQQ